MKTEQDDKQVQTKKTGNEWWLWHYLEKEPHILNLHVYFLLEKLSIISVLAGKVKWLKFMAAGKSLFAFTDLVDFGSVAEFSLLLNEVLIFFSSDR